MKKLFLTTLFLVLLNCLDSVNSQTKTIKRDIEIVTVKGIDLWKFQNYNTGNLTLYSYKNKKLKIIPFQLDKKSAGNDFIFHSKDKNILEANDDFIFASGNLGDKAYINNLKAKSVQSLEIKITDSLNNSDGYVYLIAKKNKKKIRKQVQYIAEKDKIITPYYKVAFAKEACLSLYNITLTKKGGGNNQDMFDKFKVRVYAKTIFGLEVKKTENDFECEVTGTISGSLRLIRRTKSRMMIFGFIPTPYLYNDSIFYAKYFEFPISVSIPFNASSLMKKIFLRMSGELSKNIGYKFYNEQNPQGVIIDGKMSAEEKNLNKDNFFWSVITGIKIKGGWLNRLILQKDSPLQAELYYVDDLNSNDPPEYFNGQLGAVGYIIKNLEKLNAGEQIILSAMYSLKNYKPGDEKKILQIIDNPLVVKINEVNLGF